MRKIIALLIFANLSIACVSTQNANSKETQYWNRTPDLSKVTYEGGDGKTLENAIIIKNAGNERNGIAAEYAFIGKIHGVKFVDWKPAGQSTIPENNKKVDLINILLIQKNETVSYYFDITEFYGKFD